MAVSGSIAGQEINGQKAYLFWSYTQNVATRQTTITFTFKVKRVTSTYATYKSNCNVYIEAPDGTDIYNASTYDYDITSIGVGSYLTICSASKTFTHGADGKISPITCDSGIDLSGTSVGEYLNAAGSIDPADIPVGSYLQDLGNTNYFGDIMPIAIDDNGINHTYTHTITYVFGTASGTIVTGLYYNEGTDWNIPASLAAQIPNSKTGTVVLTCKTYNGATLVGTTTLNQTLTVPSSMVPTITTLTGAVSGDVVSQAWGKYIKGKSKCTLSWSGVAGVQGSTIVSWAITATGYSYSGASTATSGSKLTDLINFVGALTFTLSITDSRGMKGTKTIVITGVDYAPPVVSAFSALRATGGVADEDGTQILTHQEYSISSCEGSNALTAQRINIKQLPSGAFGSNITVASGVDKLNTGPYVGDYSFLIQLTLTDAYTTVTALAEVQTTFSLMDFLGSTGKGMAIGKKATLDMALEVDLETLHNQNVMFRGSVMGDSDNLISTTVVGTDELLVSDMDATPSGKLKRITLDSLFAFFKIRTNYNATNIVNSSTLSVIDDYITIDANWTISTLRIDRFGPMVSFYLNCTRDAALGVGNITNDLICTIKDSTLFPCIITGFTNASGGDIMTGYIDQSGGVYISATRNGGTVLNLGVTYLI